MIWLALALAYSSVALFALAMVPHYRTVFRHVPTGGTRQFLQVGGGALAIASALATVAALGWQAGLVAWLAGLSVAGFVVTQFLTFAPWWVFTPAASLLAAFLAALAWT